MKRISIIGAGLAGSEAALQLADRGFSVRLVEMRPEKGTPVHKTGLCAELVCSNSLKSTKPESAAGMLKAELAALGSQVHAAALDNAVAAGGALAVDREAFARQITQRIQEHPGISLEHAEVRSDHMAFYDAAAPIVMADSLDMGKLFRQSRYEDAGGQVGDYLNAPFSREEYEAFIEQLIGADRVIRREFETRDLFQACQPIEEIARKGVDAPRFGTLKPVGLTDPATGRRPWAALQLRAEDAHGESYNLVGFQTNLTFPEQKRVFRMIPGLEQAEFARYGVMHRNTFINAPKLLTPELRLRSTAGVDVPVFVAGQLAGTEGYCEAIRSGLHAALHVAALLGGVKAPQLPAETAFGALLTYATSPDTFDYQPMHVNFGIMEPLEQRIRNKGQRYAAYAERGSQALERYCDELRACGLLGCAGEAAGHGA